LTFAARISLIPCCRAGLAPQRSHHRRLAMALDLLTFLQVSEDINSVIVHYANSRGEEFASNLMARIDSFENPENALCFALAGFSATRFIDTIYCETCFIHLQGIEPCDYPALIHKIITPECPMVDHIFLTEEMKADHDHLEIIKSCYIGK
jgi:Inhibitor of Apoptosis domain